VSCLIAVDLAAKMSASCCLNDDQNPGYYTVESAIDSWQVPENAFIQSIVYSWQGRYLGRRPDVMAVEDLPHGVRYSTLIKDVLRLQGRIVEAMEQTARGSSSDILFIAPRAWRAHYPGLERGTGAMAVIDVAEKLGYKPEWDKIFERAKGNGGKTKADKVASDYCSAYLIGRWALDMKAKYGTYDVPGTCRYGAREIRLKEFHAKNI
jgi:hypothetical protein